ncbi:MAG: glutathione S-transferase [Candidatus Endobugula sp.]|jgi:glutathione S-transferase
MKFIAPLEPALSPEDGATERAWSYQASKNHLVQCFAQCSADIITLVERTKKLGKAFENVEKILRNRLYF